MISRAVAAAGLIAAPASLAQVESFDLIKVQLYEQVTPSPTLLGVGFGARIFESSPGGLTSAILHAPGAAAYPLTHSPLVWGHEAFFGTVEEIDTAFPAGTYSLAVSGGSLGSQSQELVLPATHFPETPAVLNWTAAQSINPWADVILQLSPYSPSHTMEATAFVAVGSHYAPILPSQTQVIIPAGTLPAFESGLIRIEYLYQQQTPNGGFGGATSRVAFAVSAHAPFATVPSPTWSALVLGLLAAARRRH